MGLGVPALLAVTPITVAAVLRYTSGPYQIGLEWMRAETDWAMRTFGVEGIQSQTRAGNQLALGVVYSF